MRLGGPIFADSKDPEELAKIHRSLGYRAAYCPKDLNINDTVRINDLRKAFKKEDVVFAEVGAWCNPLDPRNDVAEKNISYITERLALADELEALCCVNITGSYDTEYWYAPHPDNYSAEAFDKTVEITRRIVDAVKPKHTKLTFELMPFNFLDNPLSYLELIKAIDRTQVGVHLDPVNCIVSTRTYYGNTNLIEECFKYLAPYIVSCHAKDILIRREPLSVQLDEVIPGTGILDYRSYIRCINALPNDVPLMLEHLNNEDEFSQARKYILGIAGELNVPV